MDEADKIPESDGRAADDVGHAIGKAGAVGQDAFATVEAVALADDAFQRKAWQGEAIFQTIGDAGRIFEPVIACEAVEREEVAVFQIDGARVFIG